MLKDAVGAGLRIRIICALLIGEIAGEQVAQAAVDVEIARASELGQGGAIGCHPGSGVRLSRSP